MISGWDSFLFTRITIVWYDDAFSFSSFPETIFSDRHLQISTIKDCCILRRLCKTKNLYNIRDIFLLVWTTHAKFIINFSIVFCYSGKLYTIIYIILCLIEIQLLITCAHIINSFGPSLRELVQFRPCSFIMRELWAKSKNSRRKERREIVDGEAVGYADSRAVVKN